MITLQNMIFANPIAYQIFPNMVNTYNTSTTIEYAVYSGYLNLYKDDKLVKQFTGTSTIDLSDVSGRIRFDNVTNTYSTVVGEWDLAKSQDQTMEDNIKQSMVLWYDLKKQGATNESMSTTPTLIDHSGNGHNATCHNFAWSGMSGIGGYTTDFTNWKLYQGVESTQNSLTTVGPFHETQNNWVAYTTGYLPAMQVEVKGLPEGDVITYRYVDGDLSIQKYNVSNGIWNLPESLVSETNPNVGFMWDTKLKAGVSITLIPLYPYALVSDGVDDYAIVGNLPVLNDWTIFIKKDIVEYPINYGWLLVDGGNALDATLQYKYENGFLINSFGHKIIVTDYVEKLDIFTPTSFNGNYIQKGDRQAKRTNLYLFGGQSLPQISMALYSLTVFNRTLTTEEIEWVKTNLIETEQ